MEPSVKAAVDDGATLWQISDHSAYWSAISPTTFPSTLTCRDDVIMATIEAATTMDLNLNMQCPHSGTSMPYFLATGASACAADTLELDGSAIMVVDLLTRGGIIIPALPRRGAAAELHNCDSWLCLPGWKYLDKARGHRTGRTHAEAESGRL